mmetsp:Transcript_26462/g.43245  ORF Transcript_26462/g.43245 Transcript_26462/m.43245 type:complete len:233 (-) Transcript_26462:75-773(-)|eukprot:CAMPEP_0202705376 /NCGR_PEP_ID=MMETSP1385-20130828/17923_1 /ASSEMBLY_ACC=CAM_ASM_000861 /TAXON_ID=933848 /ORGANISM="Elphidium margaritaceum" /LENGTH=232 /DNA_ID=CAMNT_0049363587 /DNA_START=155 /DNA_END=853 /DNA_ORIENTATION=-
MAVVVVSLMLCLITIVKGQCVHEFSIERQGTTDVVKVHKPTCIEYLIHAEVSDQKRSDEMKEYGKNAIQMWPGNYPEKSEWWALFKGSDGNFFWSRFQNHMKWIVTQRIASRTAKGEQLDDAAIIEKMKAWTKQKHPNPQEGGKIQANGVSNVQPYGKMVTPKAAREGAYDLYVYEEEEDGDDNEYGYSYAGEEEETALEDELDEALNEMFLAGYNKGLAAARDRKRYRYQN